MNHREKAAQYFKLAAHYAYDGAYLAAKVAAEKAIEHLDAEKLRQEQLTKKRRADAVDAASTQRWL